MLKVGLTGGIGSGKSTVTEIFSQFGITVIDADKIAHQLTRSDSESFNEIVQLLGEGFVNANGELDRKKMAQTVFSDSTLKLALEKILHPKIQQCMLQEIEQAKHSDYIILAIPLLLESNFTELVDRVLVIDADDDVRIKRIQQRDTRSEEQIRQIISHQISRNDRLQQADDILENNGSYENLKAAVTLLHHKYMQMSNQ